MLVKKSLQLLSLGALIFCVACGTAKKNRYQDNQSAIDKPDSLPFYMKKPDYKKAAELNVQLGYGYLKQKNYSRSKMKFIYALDLSPKSPEAHAGIAKYYHVVGEHDDAETHYLEAIKYSKRKAEDKHNYAIFLCDRHKVEQAKTQFIEAIDEKTYDGVAVSYQSLASCMQSHDRLEEAEKYYHAALRHDPYLSDTVLELSKITYAKKQLETSWNYFIHYKSNNNLDAKALLHGATLASELGDVDTSASLGLMLKSRYRESFEYKKYLNLIDKSTKV